MNKELIERLSSQIEDEYLSASEPHVLSWIAEQAIARYLAERGKEAVAQVDFINHTNRINWLKEEFKLRAQDGDLLFLAPQPAIPEGMALVSKKFSKDIAKRYLGRELLNMDSVWFSVATRDYERMIAAAGAAPVGNIGVSSVIQPAGKVTSIREAIDAAIAKERT